MDYVVGSVAALISGNVTPNRPKVLKRALTPMKHQPSPNVTPKSEFVGDRSIFLSPTAQKKKAIIKKSPKRIFENPDLEVTSENDENTSIISPKADKVKKHLKDDLDADIDLSNTMLSPKSPKNKLNTSVASPLSKKSVNMDVSQNTAQNIQIDNESTPKKKKKKREMAKVDDSDGKSENNSNLNTEGEPVDKSSPKKRKKSNQFTVETITADTQSTLNDQANNTDTTNQVITKKNKRKLKTQINETIEDKMSEDKKQSASLSAETEGQVKKKKNKKQKKKSAKQATEPQSNDDNTDKIETDKENIDAAPFINPNAITNQDTDSEHESDNELQSDNDETNKTVLDTGPVESSDEEEEQTPKKKMEKDSTDNKDREEHVESEEEVKRTLFVGNVPFSSKCKKEIKRIFSKYGEIETVRIRTVPVKDARVTPKLAVIKNELHPDRSTVNVYVKYKQASSVDEALAENNTVLNGHHLRVARSDVTGSEHDPRLSVFVGNLPFALEDDALRAKFEKCGQIESVRIIRDRKTNAGKGFGYVNFTSKDGVELALALSEEDLTIKNRILRVKRCTQLTASRQNSKQNVGKQQNYQPRSNYNQRGDNHQSRNNYNQRGDNYQSRNNYNQRGDSYQSRNNYNQRGDRNFQMNRPRSQFGNNRFQGDQNSDGKNEGAYRRIMNKRKPQDGNDGPPNKRPRDFNQPSREKKARKEFVGMTAAKKKFQKKKINKDQKKKKVISEILTKPRQ